MRGGTPTMDDSDYVKEKHFIQAAKLWWYVENTRTRSTAFVGYPQIWTIEPLNLCIGNVLHTKTERTSKNIELKAKQRGHT